MGAQRDTFFVAGLSDRFGGTVELKAELIKTFQPSTLVNSATFNVAHYGSAWWQDTANQRKDVPTRKVMLKERVLIPHATINHESPMPDVAPGSAAVEAVPPGYNPVVLDITAADLLDRRIVNLGYDHEKVAGVLVEILAKLASYRAPLRR